VFADEVVLQVGEGGKGQGGDVGGKKRHFKLVFENWEVSREI
jgi:hypothetical protein